MSCVAGAIDFLYSSVTVSNVTIIRKCIEAVFNKLTASPDPVLVSFWVIGLNSRRKSLYWKVRRIKYGYGGKYGGKYGGSQSAQRWLHCGVLNLP
ncbi:hypothetical protein PILCRDRAFT_830354, partial [Piloderma croceum F 1598]